MISFLSNIVETAVYNKQSSIYSIVQGIMRKHDEDVVVKRDSLD